MNFPQRIWSEVPDTFMISSTRLRCNYPLDFIETLRKWANSPRMEKDLETVFGQALHWPAAYRHIQALQGGDISLLPDVKILPASAMPGLWGGYSRCLRLIFLSADCPQDLIVPVLLEEIGHFFDQEFCSFETPGEEGACFAALVLGLPMEGGAMDDSLAPIFLEGSPLLVEAARKVRGSAKSKSSTKSGRKKQGSSRRGFIGGGGGGGGYAEVGSGSSNPKLRQSIVYATEDGVRIPQKAPGDRLIGSRGNDSFVVLSQNVKIEDPMGGTDTVESTGTFSLANHSLIENLVLTGAGDTSGTGNSKANTIVGNSGNNSLDGGTGSDTIFGGGGSDTLDGGQDSEVDILAGGLGDDSYIYRDTLDQIVENSGEGSDTILTTLNVASLADFGVANVENLTFTGTGSATLSGNALANVLTGGKLADTLFGSEGDTLIGWQGDDVYYVNSLTTRILELDGALDGNDTISTALASYSMAAARNVEVLVYTGSSNSALAGNSGNNSIFGALAPKNTIDGGVGDDYLFGGDTTDSLYGGEGNDTLAVARWADNPTGALGTALRSNRGNDTLNGGAGDDWYVVDSQTAFNYQDTLGSNTIASTVDFSLKYNANISANIQNLYLIGETNLRGTGSDIANSITGNDGGNTIAAGSGNDTVYGGLGADLISGEAGDDTLIGGGQPQTDLAADASTPVEIQSGQTFHGKFERRFDQDWIKVAFTEGETYTITINATLSGNEIFKQNSWIYLGDPVKKDGSDAYGNTEYLDYSSNDYWWGDWWSYNYDGYDDNKFQVGYKFTAFDTGEFFLPVVVDGPATGSYELKVASTSSSESAFPEVLADDGQNTIIGGLGNDFLVAGNGRDTLGDPIGDVIFGGTNGIPGAVDLDSSSKQNITASLISKKGYYKIESLGTTNWSTLGAATQVVGTIFQATLDGSLVGGSGIAEVPRDSIIGGDGGDLLDAGNGMDLMIGGKGNDAYFVDYPFDIVIEEDNGGHDDIAIFSYGVTRTLTGATYDVNLTTGFSNVEHASLVGSAHLHVLGNGDANSLHGNFGDNLLNGHAGNDSLFGRGGNDYLIGGDGGDLLDSGSGQNTMDGGLGDDTYVVNDREDRVINEIPGLDGGADLVRTYFNFDPIQGSDKLQQFQPNQPDNSPSRHKAPSFASRDITSFYNVENFEMLGEAVYGVGNALGNSLLAGESSALLLGMGGEDTLFGKEGNDSLYGDTPDFYASPDLYAPAPTDTRTQQFLDSVIGDFGSDYLEGGAGDDYLDGGKAFDTMIGGEGNDTFVQDNVDDYVVAGDGANELISSVNIAQAPDGISKLMLVVADQTPDSGQPEVADSASAVDLAEGNDIRMELMYAPRAADRFVIGGVTDDMDAQGNSDVYSLNVSPYYDDLDFPGQKMVELSWVAGTYAETGVVGYTVRFRQLTNSDGAAFVDNDGNPDIWHTYVNGTSQDFQGTQANPSLVIRNLADGTYDFEVVAYELAIPALKSRTPDSARHVTLQGGGGDDEIYGWRVPQILPGGLGSDSYTNPLLQNNPIAPLPLGFIFNPDPYNVKADLPDRFATYLDGGFGNDYLNGDYVNDLSGDDYTFQNVVFKGLNTMLGGQGSDTFVVKNGGNAIGDEFDWVVKYGNETPVVTEVGNIGSSLNGGQHNVVYSLVDYLTLSDTLVHQGKFIDQLIVNGGFGMGNRLENYISGLGTLVGNTGRDSISGVGLLIGGTAYGTDDVGFAVRDFAGVIYGGNGLVESAFRDTDPVPTDPNGPGAADSSQFWVIPGNYGPVFDPNRNQDTVIAGSSSILDGGAGRDSLVGSGLNDMFYVSQGRGGVGSHDIGTQDAVFGNEGNDTVMFTDSDYLWWSGHLQGALLAKNEYSIERGSNDGDSDISNLILQAGSPSARIAIGSDDSTGNPGFGSDQGANYIVGNEFDNVINGGGVGGFLKKGTGVDVLKGGAGSDNFVVQGYNSSTTNEWSPDITDYEDGPLAGFSLWKPQESVYTDADYVLIEDFEAGDNLKLSGSTGSYWIGDAPVDRRFPTPSSIGPNGNVPLLGYLQTPNTTRFGIYTSSSSTGGPNLVAIVNLVGGMELDTLSLELPDNYNPAPSNIVATNSLFRDHLGWGTFWKLEGSSFSKYVNQAYTMEDSYASLETLVRSGDDTFTGGVLADYYNGYGANDSLLGGGGNDTLLGESGNDSLFGDAGNDSLLGGKGADYINGGFGDDQMIGGSGDDTFVVDALTDAVTEQANEGTDLVIASVSGYALTANANLENLTLTGTAINGSGNALPNRLTGNALDNTLAGLAGDDTLDGGVGTDTLQGGANDDTYIVDNTNDTIEDSSGTDTVRASASFDLSASKVADTDLDGIGDGIEHLVYTGTTIGVSLSGNSQANSITGAAGSDTLDGKAGNDNLIGGAGDDYYVFTANSDNDTIVETDGTDTVLSDTHFDLAATSLNTLVVGLADIENIHLTSTVGASLFGNTLNNLIIGNSGDDTLNGRASSGTLSGDTLNGGNGNDLYIVDSTSDLIDDSGGTDTVLTSVSFDLSNTLVGGGTAIEHLTFTSATGSTLVGNAAANSIRGGSGTGADLMIGGQGNDTYFVGANDVVKEESLNGGVDWVIASADFVLGDFIENLVLDGNNPIHGVGNSVANTIYGNSAANSIDGGAGIDSLIGGAGNDTYSVDDIGDVIVELAGEGIDTVVAKFNGYLLGDNVEHLVLASGVAGVLNGSGNEGDNSITGNSFSNILFGGDGNDTLTGSRTRGSGEIDTLRGGAGADVFALGDRNDIYYTADALNDYALIQDFNTAEDKLQIKGAFGNYLVGGIDGDGYQSITVVATSELIAKVKTQAADAITLNTISVQAV